MGINPTMHGGVGLQPQSNRKHPFSLTALDLRANSIAEENANDPASQMRCRDRFAAYAGRVIYQYLLPERA
jgi:hypothetical protein